MISCTQLSQEWIEFQRVEVPAFCGLILNNPELLKLSEGVFHLLNRGFVRNWPLCCSQVKYLCNIQ